MKHTPASGGKPVSLECVVVELTRGVRRTPENIKLKYTAVAAAQLRNYVPVLLGCGNVLLPALPCGSLIG